MRRQEAGELQDGLGGVSQEAGDGGVGHGAATRPTPPIPLLVGRDRAGDRMPGGLVEELYGDMVGVPVARLHLMGIEPGWEEQDLLPPRRVQDFVHVGRNARVPRQRPQGRCLQWREVPVAPTHFQHRRHHVRVAAIGGDEAVLHRGHFQCVVGGNPLALRVEVARAFAEHRQGLVHTDDDREGLAAREPLHLNLDVAGVDIVQRQSRFFQRGVVARERVPVTHQTRQQGHDVVEILVRVPPAPHPLHIQLERLHSQPLAVENTHSVPASAWIASQAFVNA